MILEIVIAILIAVAVIRFLKIPFVIPLLLLADVWYFHADMPFWANALFVGLAVLAIIGQIYSWVEGRGETE